MHTADDPGQATLSIAGERHWYFSLAQAENRFSGTGAAPISLRILAENLLRHAGGSDTGFSWIADLSEGKRGFEIPFYPARVLLQDMLGVPALVDLAGLRDAIAESGRDPLSVNPKIPVDFVIDHSLIADVSASKDAMTRNVALQYERNRERFEFLAWCQQAFSNLRVVPPDSGIVHQLNVERLARVIWQDAALVYPDTVICNDSHTPMVNGIGVLGWGVGGIEAEAAMLGRALSIAVPEVLGVRAHGELAPGVGATDLVLTATELFRRAGVVGKFVEFFGDGLDRLSVADRATLANMAPEYGATCVFFPVDRACIDYLRVTGRDHTLGDGDVIIAAITSCTNTSNPANMIAAGLFARNAAKRGLAPNPWVKTSFAPGSKVVPQYLQRAGLMDSLESLGFHLTGFGCTTCNGNSGPLAAEIEEAIRAHDLVAIAVLSGNRNFEGRVHPLARGAYLASPALVIAYAIAGRVTVDIASEPLGRDPAGFTALLNMRALAILGDMVSTDHLAPAGGIAEDSPAGRYLAARKVPRSAFISYGMRRGHHEVAMRATLASPRLKNDMVQGAEGGITRLQPDGTIVPIYDAARVYRSRGIGLLIIAGREYGAGSSRDWAAKGPALLGVRAVIAESFERIHRSNLIGMGVLPLELVGCSKQALALDGSECFDVLGIDQHFAPSAQLTLRIRATHGGSREIALRSRIDSAEELVTYRHGGLLPQVYRELVERS
jgi:aconitase A